MLNGLVGFDTIGNIIVFKLSAQGMISEELSESKSLYINKKCQFNVSISL